MTQLRMLFHIRKDFDIPNKNKRKLFVKNEADGCLIKKVCELNFIEETLIRESIIKGELLLYTFH